MSPFEQDLVDWLWSRRRTGEAISLGIGDDMAIVRNAAGVVLITSDLLLDGVHFDTARHDFPSIGRKAIACSLSDCAAMAVRPLAATVSLAWSSMHTLDKAKALYEGMESIADAFGVVIVGGDTTRWSAPLAVDVTMLAEPYPGIDPIRRDGARVGDRLYVTGPLGGSIRGRHLRFTPRVEEAHQLASHLRHRLHAMMDLSDGLSLDLWRMCRASGVGAELNGACLDEIISDDARSLGHVDGRSPLEHALSDGEDFELLLAVEGEVKGLNVSVHEIGRMTAAGLTLCRGDGTVEALEPRGFVH